MKSRNNIDKLREVARFLGGAFHKIGQSRYPGGRLVALEGRNGRKAFANFQTIFIRGKPVGSRLVGWARA
jgi:hypothetical protein